VASFQRFGVTFVEAMRAVSSQHTYIVLEAFSYGKFLVSTKNSFVSFVNANTKLDVDFYVINLRGANMDSTCLFVS